MTSRKIVRVCRGWIGFWDWTAYVYKDGSHRVVWHTEEGDELARRIVDHVVAHAVTDAYSVEMQVDVR